MRKTLAVALLALVATFGALELNSPKAVQAQTAQNTLTQTTITALINASQNFIPVASATGITTSQNTTATILYIDGEEMVVVGVSGTQIHVTRGAGGTPAAGHASGAMVLAGNPTYFYNHDPQGACVPGSVLSTPYVNVISGNQWLCSTVTKSWVPGYYNASLPGGATVTTAVASAAGVVLPSGPLFHITGALAITGFTTPIGCNATAVGACQFTVIPDGTFTWTAAGNIAVLGTAVVNRALTFTWDATNSKWVPSYV